MSSPVPPAIGALLAAAGGALGALIRYGVGELWPTAPHGFPWAVLLINLSGSALLALLPAVPVVRVSRHLPVLLGSGLLGGYTTLSAWSEQTIALVDRGEAGTALGYALVTLTGCLGVAWLVDRGIARPLRASFETAGGDE